jgi:hypothetical protein
VIFVEMLGIVTRRKDGLRELADDARLVDASEIDLSEVEAASHW